MLSDRRQRVLSALIQEYIEYALPVASRTLTERYALGVSSATIRNDLSALEDAGYIHQPHTSAGRIPTDFGYRTYVDEIISTLDSEFNDAQQRLIESIQEQASEVDSLIDRTSEALAHLTNCLSIVASPSVSSLGIKRVSYISLSDYQAILVAVLEDGKVLNRSVVFTEPVASERLRTIEDSLNLCISGKSLDDLQGCPVAAAEIASGDPLFEQSLEELEACLADSYSNKTHRMGLPALLKKPEFSSAQALMPIMEILEDDTVLMHLFDQTSWEQSPCSVSIGSENRPEALSGVSVVAAPYGSSSHPGIIAVIGPTRMDYKNVIDAVRIAQQALRDR